MERKLFKTLSPQQFAGIIKWFKNNTEKARLHLENAAAYAVGRLYETGDIKHINKLAPVVEAFGFGPAFRRCVVPFVCFPYDKEALLFTGSIQKGKRAALEELDENGIPKWEVGMRERFDNEGKPREKKEPDYAKRLCSSVAAALNHGMQPADVKKLVSETISKQITTVAEKKAA